MCRFSQKADIMARSVAGATLLVPVKGDREALYTLNASAEKLWECLAEPCTVDTMARRLTDHYPGLDARQAELDVLDFLTEMRQRDLIVSIPP